MIKRWYNQLFAGPRRRSPPRKPSYRRSTMLQLEALEDRLVPSNFLVTNSNSSGAGSLAVAITSANADNISAEVITFSSTTWTGGQTITLANTLNLTNTKYSITIDGTFGSTGQITISGGGKVRDFLVNGGVTAVLKNLTVSGGAVGSSNGAGIANQGGNLSLTNCTLSGNTVSAANGGALYNGSGGTVILNTCTISANAATGTGGSSGCGAFVQQDPGSKDQLTVTNCTIQNNVSFQGGAFNCGDTITVTGSTIQNNTATGSSGGGILFGSSGVLSVTNSSIIGNSAPTGGGICAVANGTSTINNCIISGNSAASGAGIYAGTPGSGSSTLIVNTGSTIQNNVSSGVAGGLYVASGNSATIDDSTVGGNTGTNGGGIYAGSGATLTVQNNSVIQKNSASNGGGIYFAGTALTMQSGTLGGDTISGNTGSAEGGGIDIIAGSATIANTTLTGNSAGTSGSGNSGAAIVNHSTGTVNITSCTITGNSTPAGTGGGVAGIWTGAGTVTLSNSSITSNTGIGIYCNACTLTLSGTTISGNTAVAGTLAGGGIYVGSASATFDHSTISGNSAATGGGFYAGSGATLTVQNNSLIQNNTASSNGGGFYFAGASLTIQSGALGGSTISGNTTSGNGGGLDIASGSATITGSTLAGNSATGGNGAGVFNAGTLTVNTATIGGGSPAAANSAVNGGGIFSIGTLTVQSSSVIQGNIASAMGGGVDVVSGTATITASTISGNSATGSGNGGGIANSGTLTLTKSTVSGNQASNGAGIYNSQTPMSVLNLSSGLNASGTLITTNGTADANWTVQPAGKSAYPALVITPAGGDWFPGYVANGPNSDWISDEATNPYNAAPPVIYSRTFDLTGYNLANVSIVGSWTIADGGSLSLNGNTIASSAAQWGTLNSYTVPAGSPFLNAGSNTLTMNLTTSDQDYDSADCAGNVMLAGTGSLTLSTDTISNNTASNNGGGVDIAGGTATITGSTIAGNTVSGSSSTGGGIVNTGTLTVDSTTVGGGSATAANSAPNGGGIYSTGTLTVQNASVIEGNLGAIDGGGIFVAGGSALITGSTITANTAGGGGGIYNTATVIVTGSTISSNAATTGAAGGFSDTGGTATLVNCAVINNTAPAGHTGGVGAGQPSTTSVLVMTNCTVAGNSGGATGGIGGSVIGGTLSLTLTNCTVSGNTGATSAGGVYLNATTLTATLTNTLVAGNISTGTSPDIFGTITSGSNNLVGNGTGMTGIANKDANGNQVGTAASPINSLLGTLALNGGTTQNMLPQTGSPAIDTGAAITQLGAAITTTTATSITAAAGNVFAATSLPVSSTGPYFTIQIGAEQMAVTAVTISGNTATLTVTRGVNGTTAATYAPNASIFLMSDQRGSTPSYTPAALVNIGAVEGGLAVVGALSFSVQPTGTTVGNTLNTITVADMNGSKPIPNATVTIALSSGPLTGTTTATTNASGLATFAGLSINMIGTYTMTASASLTAGATSSQFIIGPGLVVTTISDALTHTGNSLRDALGLANSDAAAGKSDIITFAPALNTQTITLTQGAIALSAAGGTISINGNGAANTIVSGNNTYGLTVGSALITGVMGTFQNLTLAKFSGSSQGLDDGFVNYGTMTLNTVTVTSTPQGGLENAPGGIMTLNSCSIINSLCTSGAYGGGIASQGGTVTFNNSTISGNSCATGGGIYVSAGTLIVNNSSISNNTATIGGGLWMSSGTVTLNGDTIGTNSAPNGSGIYQAGGTLIIQNGTSASTINGNITSGNGGGIDLAGGNATINNATINGNTAAYGGGILVSGGSLTVQNNTTISNNLANGTGTTANNNGGGIDLTGGSATILASTVKNNTATAGAGGIGICNATLTATSATITGNLASTAGGGLKDGDIAGGGTATLTACTVSGNSTTSTSGTGGGIANSGTLTVDSTTLGGTSAAAANSAANGGGIYSTGTLTVKNSSVIQGNTATTSGGGVDVAAGTATITASTISGNFATGSSGSGGGIANSASLTLSNCTVSGNQAASGAGIYNLQTTISPINLATGLDASNQLLSTSGAADAHWTVDQHGGGTAPAQVVTASSADGGFFAGWAADGPNSDWIALNANTSAPGPSPYTFYRTFDLTGANLANVSIVGQWAIDDQGTLMLNGNTIASTASFSLMDFSVPADSPFFKQGLNTLTITMTFSDNSYDAVRLEGSVTGSSVGTLALQGDTISNNTATTTGGGIEIAGGSATITGTTISTNTATKTGGGIDVTAGNLTVIDGTISANTASKGGGGIYFDGGGSLTLQAGALGGVTISGNKDSGNGSGINLNSGTATIANATLQGNTENGTYGGGIYNNATMMVADCTLFANSTAPNTAGGGGGAIFNAGTLTAANSTLTGNTSAVNGGGFREAGTASLINCTITNNIATNSGGGVFNPTGTTTLVNCTITGNSAGAGGGGVNSNGQVSLFNTIVAGNTCTSGTDVKGAVTGTSNLIGDGTGMTGIANKDTNGNQVGTTASPIKPLLAALASNGGPTQTMLLQSGSPAAAAGGAVTQATATVPASATSFTVANAAVFSAFSLPTLPPGSSYGTIQIEAEQMAVTGVTVIGDGTATLTVTRGINSTGTIGHPGGTSVFLVSDQRNVLPTYYSPAVVNIGAVENTLAKLSFTAQPSNTTTGNTIGSVVVQDLTGSTPNAGAVIAISISSPGQLTGTLTATTNTSGNAIFSTLAAAVNGTFTLTASVGAITAPSSSFTVVAPTLTNLTFTTQPISQVAGSGPIPTVVQAKDQMGYPMPGAALTYSIAPGTLPGSTVATTGPGGLANFSLAGTLAGTYVLTATQTGGLLNTSSNPFVISPAAAATLSFLTSPNNALAGTTLNAANVLATDQFGNFVPGTKVTLSLSVGPLGGTTMVTTDPSGQASFTTLSVSTAGTYFLTASATGTNSPKSGSFVITALPPPSITVSSPTVTVSEGSTATITGTFNDPSGNTFDTLTASIGTVTQNNSLGTWSWSFPTTLGPEQSKTVTITDTSTVRGSAAVSFGLVVNNVPPTVAAAASNSTTYYYVNWTSANVAGGTASGIITLPDGSTVNVGFTALNADGSAGSLYGAQLNGLGPTYYWSPASTWTSSQVQNVPPTADIIQLVGGLNETYHLTFSKPIVDPIMDILSLGGSGSCNYDFDSPFSLLSQGPSSSFGGGPTNLVQLPGNILQGTEGDGTIQFLGNYSTFSWTVPKPETWHGFTFGIQSTQALASVKVVEGQTAATSGTFSDPGNDTVTIAASVGTITQTSGNSGTWSWSYPTTDVSQSQTVTITANDNNGATSTTTFALVVSDAPLTDTTPVKSYAVAEGSSTGQQVLATFSDANPLATLSEFPITNVTVTWGATTSGTPTYTIQQVSKTASASTWEVLGSATYAQYGSFPVAVTVKDTGGQSVTTSNTTFNVAAVISTLSFSVQPVGAFVGSSLGSVTVRAVDKFGNPVSAASISLTLSTGTLNGTTTAATDPSGNAVFSTLSVGTPGTYTLKASAAGVTAVTSLPFTIVALPLANLTFSKQPASPTLAGSNLGAVTVLALNANSQPVGGATVVISIAPGTLNGTLSAVTNASGQAIFSTLSETIVGTYTLTAKSGLISTPSNPFTITAAGAATLSFVSQPSAAMASAILNPVNLLAKDKYGNVATGTMVTLKLSASLLSGTTAVTTDTTGTASFTTLVVNTGGTYTITASATGTNSPVSSSFIITPLPVTNLSFTKQPASPTLAGSNLGAVTVLALNANSQPVGGATVVISIAPGTLNGTLSAVTNASGQAIFSTLSETIVGTYTLTAKSGLISTPSNPFTITAAGAATLSFVSQPSAAMASAILNPVNLLAKDKYGNVATGTMVTLKLSASLLSGTTAVTTDTTGTASFTTLLVNTGGTYTITASATGTNSPVSSSFIITPLPVTNLSFTKQPASPTLAGSNLGAVTVLALNANSQPVGGATVVISIAPGTLNGTLSAVTNASGQAIFSTLSETIVGTYTLTAKSGLISTPSNPFTITAAGAATLSFVSQPSAAMASAILNPVNLLAKDKYGNVATGTMVTLKLSASALSGTTAVTTDTTGTASFTTLLVNTGGTYTITASATGTNSPVSSSFIITPLPVTNLTFTKQPASPTLAGSNLGAVTVLALNANSQPVGGATVVISIAPGTLNGTLSAVTNASGQAIFSTLSETIVGTYTLTATKGSVSTQSASFTITAAAGMLTFMTQPVNTASGPISTVTVQVKDKYGNAVSGTSVGLALSPGKLTSGTTTITTSPSGQAVFSDLVETTVGTYSLVASASGLTSITSNKFTISVGLATMLTFLTQPTKTTAGATLSTFTVAVVDQYGNVVPQAGRTIMIGENGLTTGPYTTNAQGQAIISNWTESSAGSHQLTALSSGLTSALSNSFAISAGKGIIHFLTQPQNGTMGSTLASVTVLVTDTFGNPVAGAVVNITLSSGTIGGATPITTNSSGLATFNTLIENVAGRYSLIASASGLASVSSISFTITT